VILLDANLLLYAYNKSFSQQARARAWLEEVLSKSAPVGLPWTTLLAFVRISTNPQAFPEPLSIDEATSIVSELLDHPTVVIPEPPDTHWDTMRTLLMTMRVRGPEVMDAHLAALALGHGATLCSTDRGFARFRGVRLLNPLEERA